jgi:hypothetical protein
MSRILRVRRCLSTDGRRQSISAAGMRRFSNPRVSVAGGPLRRDVLFGVVLIGRRKNARLRPLWRLPGVRRRRTSTPWTTLLDQPNNNAQVRCGDQRRQQHMAESWEQVRNASRDSSRKQWSSARSRFRRCTDPRRTTPATRPSRFLSRPILRPMPRDADVSPFSTSHGTCSARHLARLPGVGRWREAEHVERRIFGTRPIKRLFSRRSRQLGVRTKNPDRTWSGLWRQPCLPRRACVS